ncbi:MAG: maltose alpha-D-glucosyltransferase [Vulcanimicrobiaceae bacterium]
MTSDALWYKDAVIYQLHVKAFFDSDGDGTGDFRGLIEKLDYIVHLGASAVWLLPFYPSPLRDDGYDVADYRGVHRAYGTLADVRSLVHAAHKRGLRVITELAVNHTSDQHPWFQRARRARKGSVRRDFYVWSDSDERYRGTRIIFTDTETSNWTWDPIAKAYFWHRFFSHQPDLNFDNPHVFEAVANVMRFWFDMGIDGMRLDAVPYLCEREGTSNENLPETHAIVKRLRKIVDDEYPGRMLLAEANQWPEDVRPYFGEGDECHMAFHFPLMPRMFMSIALEDRYPMYDIMRQTPAIPENAQWAIFLRNHDEMTLEMVTDAERAFLYSVYAADARARLNVGIRRRLAPLLDNDRRKIELMTSLLLTMPGTPVIYYGDEIGMGDNIYLRDRDGVRTPMQWSPDRNGGFSKADAQQLYLPVVQDPVYGYAAVNVEAQVRSPSSLLNWMRRTIAVRQAHRVFGRGKLSFLYPENRHVAAYLREFEGQSALCVANLAHSSQAVTLDLSRFAGRTPVEMFDWSAFQQIGGEPYVLTLPGYAFYWFLLTEPAAVRSEPLAPAPPEFVTLVVPAGTRGLLERSARNTLERDVLPLYLPAQSWAAHGEQTLSLAKVVDAVPLGSELDAPLLSLVATRTRDGVEACYALPVGLAWETSTELPAAILRAAFARARAGPRSGYAFDATAGERFWLRMLEALRGSARLEGQHGSFICSSTWSFDALAVAEQPQVRRVEDRNDERRVIGNEIGLKLYRHLASGPHPEIEMSRYLHDANFPSTPPLLGWIEYRLDRGESLALGVAHRFVESQGDCWNVTLRYLERFLERRRQTAAPGVAPDDSGADDVELYERSARVLGETLASLHRTLARPSDDPAFAPEEFTADDVSKLAERLHAQTDAALESLERALESSVPAAQLARARALIVQRAALHERIDALTQTSTLGRKTRIHGRFHLGNVLVTATQFLIIGFEGDPLKPLAERRLKSSPLDDVALLVQSFDYAVTATLLGLTVDRTEHLHQFEPEVERWRRRAATAFLAAYWEASDVPLSAELLGLYVIDKALRSLIYELTNRPSWIAIPLDSLERILAAVHAAPA